MHVKPRANSRNCPTQSVPAIWACKVKDAFCSNFVKFFTSSENCGSLLTERANLIAQLRHKIRPGQLLVFFPNSEIRLPARCDRFVARVHIGLVRQFITLAGVALNAGGNDVFPTGLAALVPRDYVIEIQLPLRERQKTVLAGVLVAPENISTRKCDFLAWHFVVAREHDNFGNAQRDFHRVNHLRLRCPTRIVKPRVEIMGLEFFLALFLNNPCMANTQQVNSPARRACLHRLPVAVQDQHGFAQHFIHGQQISYYPNIAPTTRGKA